MTFSLTANESKRRNCCDNQNVILIYSKQLAPYTQILYQTEFWVVKMLKLMNFRGWYSLFHILVTLHFIRLLVSSRLPWVTGLLTTKLVLTVEEQLFPTISY